MCGVCLDIAPKRLSLIITDRPNLHNLVENLLNLFIFSGYKISCGKRAPKFNYVLCEKQFFLFVLNWPGNFTGALTPVVVKEQHPEYLREVESQILLEGHVIMTSMC